MRIRLYLTVLEAKAARTAIAYAKKMSTTHKWDKCPEPNFPAANRALKKLDDGLEKHAAATQAWERIAERAKALGVESGTLYFWKSRWKFRPCETTEQAVSREMEYDDKKQADMEEM